MRNNEDRLGARNIDSDAPPQARGGNNSSSFSFSTPTEFVELPSKGLFYPENHPLHKEECVEIKFMTAKEEGYIGI